MQYGWLFLHALLHIFVKVETNLLYTSSLTGRFEIIKPGRPNFSRILYDDKLVVLEVKKKKKT